MRFLFFIFFIKNVNLNLISLIEGLLLNKKVCISMVTLMIKLVKILIKGNRFELDSNVLPDKVNGLLPI